jgi:hypothetical protein
MPWGTGMRDEGEFCGILSPAPKLPCAAAFAYLFLRFVTTSTPWLAAAVSGDNWRVCSPYAGC